jgi:hypothetical protein
MRRRGRAYRVGGGAHTGSGHLGQPRIPGRWQNQGKALPDQRLTRTALEYSIQTYLRMSFYWKISKEIAAYWPRTFVYFFQGQLSLGGYPEGDQRNHPNDQQGVLYWDAVQA